MLMSLMLLSSGDSALTMTVSRVQEKGQEWTLDQNFSKAHVVGNGTLNSDTVMTDTILNIFPARFTKIATAGTEDITIFRKTIDDSSIWHFVRGVKNLKISERSVNILDGKRLVAELDNIFLKKFSLN